MKLRTEMKVWSDGNTYPSVCGEREVYPMLEHDAACAHALMLAMDQIGGGYLYLELADELMREWTGVG